MASKVESPTKGTSKAEAMPLAVAKAMRTPVNEPGPRPTATKTISSWLTPACSQRRLNVSSKRVFDAR